MEDFQKPKRKSRRNLLSKDSCSVNISPYRIYKPPFVNKSLLNWDSKCILFIYLLKLHAQASGVDKPPEKIFKNEVYWLYFLKCVSNYCIFKLKYVSEIWKFFSSDLIQIKGALLLLKLSTPIEASSSYPGSISS